MARRTEVFRPEGHRLSYTFKIVGGRQLGFRDAYHALLRMPWSVVLGLGVAVFLLLNLIFALLYVWLGGVANARPASLADAFFFSVETMATIGYGSMYPASTAANVLMVAESMVGLLVTALSTGIVFARFSRLRGRVVYSNRIAFSEVDGVPTIQIRVGNERSNRIFDVEFQLFLTRTVRTAEGVSYYKTEDLPLVRNRAHSLARSWTLLHPVRPGTPMHGHTPESLAAADAEIIVALSGVDETSLQPIHSRHTWEHPEIAWGARLADILTEDAQGVTLDLTRFQDLLLTEPTSGFPYPRR